MPVAKAKYKAPPAGLHDYARKVMVESSSQTDISIETWVPNTYGRITRLLDNDDNMPIETPDTVQADHSYASRYVLPPAICTRTSSTLLIGEVLASNVTSIPSYVRDLGSLSKDLARRVIWDTDRQLIISDEVVHGRAMLLSLRSHLPCDVLNIKVQYFKGNNEHLGSDYSREYTDPPTDYESVPEVGLSSDEELISDTPEISRRSLPADRKTRMSQKRLTKEERRKRWDASGSKSVKQPMCTPMCAPAALGPQPDEDGTVITKRLIDDRTRARSIDHLLCHNPPCATCEGCQARSRQKKHHKGAYEASP